jgi:DNA 3'-phosphatase
MSIVTDYSPYWKDLGTALMYRSPDFQFKSGVVITEFENCLISKLSTNKLYHAIDPKTITPYNTDFIKKLSQDSKDFSIVIISNQISGSKLLIDTIKRKIEAFVEIYKFPILALFALKPNRLSKPHTGMWHLLSAYYKSNRSHIQKALVVSDLGGRIIEHERKNGTAYQTFDSSDVDRAFASNIGIPYYTILEYVSNKKEKYSWNKRCLPPEIRVLYTQKLSEYKNPNIFARLAELGQSETYMIMIYGAPRSGKTTLAKEIMHKWRKSDYGKNHAIKRFGRDKFTKTKKLKQCQKALEDRISVIVDGDCHSDALRKPYVDLAKANHTPILHIEVNPGIGMSYIFNHVMVENSTDENINLYDDKEYHIYQSKVKRPEKTILYCPQIKKTTQVMEFRY